MFIFPRVNYDFNVEEFEVVSQDAKVSSAFFSLESHLYGFTLSVHTYLRMLHCNIQPSYAFFVITCHSESRQYYRLSFYYAKYHNVTISSKVYISSVIRSINNDYCY